jgi:hypothetical protein
MIILFLLFASCCVYYKSYYDLKYVQPSNVVIAQQSVHTTKTEQNVVTLY